MDDPPKSSPPPIADDMIRLNWTRNNVFNTIISSEDNEIMYEVSTPNRYAIKGRVTTISKMDKSSGQKVFAGEIAWKALRGRTLVRIGWQNCEWMQVQNWLTNPKEGMSTLCKIDCLTNFIPPGPEPSRELKALSTDGKAVVSNHMSVSLSVSLEPARADSNNAVDVLREPPGRTESLPGHIPSPIREGAQPGLLGSLRQCDTKSGLYSG
ncbi:hypothetical protein FRC04_010746 [Tulasnella sp. 424]|nr:hypothetical protein FRC04_010746 [Tulasnella sp. 424]KAG8969271.1 hypothetical protein FRC05_001130 [Tulasnella sp. 425]